MTRDTDAELDELLDALLPLDAGARLAWLEAHATDAGLRAQALDILAAAEQPGLVDRVRARLAADDETPHADAIGAYRLLRRIGKGGMATVYLAEREIGAARQCVALKLMRNGLYDRTQQALFRREQKILAGLEHPGIARLIDAGLTAADVPFLVMEYVDGEPLDRHCEARALPLRARLQLFLEVCGAVAYAHRNLIVHRDLKPSNILVTGDGALKLLDFGIAKILDDSGDATRTEMRLMTPGYAAPEQVAGRPITTATDVYSLGVILHELATGARPVQRSDGTLTRPSNALPTPRRRERRLLRGDLDGILLRALHADPDRRYANAREFADDIERHLDGRPVHARPDRWSYRASRFLLRNRIAAAAAAIVALVLVAATFVSLREAAVARAEAARAIRTKNFLVGVFEELNPVEAKGNEPPSVKEFLRTTIDKAHAELPDIPDAETEIVLSAADTLRQLGEVDESGRIVDRTLADVRGRKVGGLALAHALNMQGYLRFTQGKLDDAERAAAEALALYEAQGAANTSRVLEASQPRAILADIARQRGDYARAMQLHARIIEETRAQYGDSFQLARRLQFSVIPYVDVGRLDEAERIQREAMAMAQRWRGADHRVPMQMRRLLADILFVLGMFALCYSLFRELLDYKRLSICEMVL
jgi:serine/threonine-protein kinase